MAERGFSAAAGASRPIGARFCAALAAALVSIAAFSFAQESPSPSDPAVPPHLAAVRVEPQDVRVGDEATIVVELPGEAKARSIELKLAESQALSVVLADATSTDGTTWRIPARFLAKDAAKLEPAIVEADMGGETPATFTTAEAPVGLVPPEAEEGDLRDWTAPMAAPFSWARAAKQTAKYASVAALAALPLLALFLWLRRRKPAAALSAATARTPLEELDLELAELRSLAEFRARGAEAHYTRLSMALRRYFEGTGQFAAVEMSDDEVLAHLRHRLAGRPAAALLAPIFDAGSLAKFARQAVTEADAREHLDSATAFCADERDRLRAQIAAAGRAA